MAIRDARCAFCHRPIREVGGGYAISWPRRLRVCLECEPVRVVRCAPRWLCWR